MSDEHDREAPLAGPGGLTETLLRWVRRKGLRVPAALLLEMHRPLMPLAWSVAMLAGGVVGPLFGPNYYEKIEALRDPKLLDRLLARLQADDDAQRDREPEE